MKKIFIFLSVIALGVAAASCSDLNVTPVFDDANAFVEVNKTAVSVSEDGGTVSIPVTLASLSGKTENVSYVLEDGTAKQGVDYELVDPTATLKFSADARTQNIVVKIINRAGVYTGDLKFTATLKSAGSCALGVNTTCSVTITDNDHPLAAILGKYTAKANSYFSGDIQWTAEFTKDPDDVTVVHINSLSSDLDWDMVGSVNDAQTEITIACGQTYVYGSSYNIKLYTYDGSYIYDETEVPSVTLVKDASGKWTMSMGLSFYAYYISSGSAAGNWDIINPGTMVLTKD